MENNSGGGGGDMLDRLLVALGFQIDDERLEQFTHKSDDLRNSILRVGAVASAAAIGLGLLTKGVADSLGEIKLFADLNQLSARSVQAMIRVGQENEVSQEAMMDGIQTISQRMGEAALHLGRGRILFQRLGMSVKDSTGHLKSFDTMFAEIVDKMHGLPRAEQLTMARRLGIDPKFILVLQQGKEKLNELLAASKAGNPFSEEDYERAEEINKLFIRAKLTLGLFAKMVGVSLFPVLEKALQAWLKWFAVMRKTTNSDLITFLRILSGTFNVLLAWLLRVVHGIERAYSWLRQFRVVTWLAAIAVATLLAFEVGKFFIGIATAVATAAKALWAFDAAAALPAIAVGALVIAIGLLVDELVNYYEGNKTVLGQLQSKYPYAVHLAWLALSVLSAMFVALKWTAIRSMLSILFSVTETFVAIAALSFYTVAAVIANLARLATVWVVQHAKMAAATLAAYWPYLLIVAAIALIAFGVYELWKHWDFVSKKVTGVIDVITGKLKEWLVVIQAIATAITGVFEKLTGFSLIKNFLIKHAMQLPEAVRHLLPALPEFGPEMALAGAAAVGPAMVASHQVLGRGSMISSHRSTSRVSHVTQHISAPITINDSPDPRKTGAAVKEHISDLSKDAIRNGQDGVGL